MKSIAEMTSEELAGLICQSLKNSGVTVALTGGGCVAIWSDGKYSSSDLDLIEEGTVPRQKLRVVLADLGFVEDGRYFIHPDSDFFVEFPNGPLMVGDDQKRRGTKPTLKSSRNESDPYMFASANIFLEFPLAFMGKRY